MSSSSKKRKADTSSDKQPRKRRSSKTQPFPLVRNPLVRNIFHNYRPNTEDSGGQSPPPSVPHNSATLEESPGSTVSGQTTQTRGGSLKGDREIHVEHVVNDGEYILKLTSIKTKNPIEEQERTAAVLLSQADILRELGEKLLSHIGASFRSEIYESFNM